MTIPVYEKSQDNLVTPNLITECAQRVWYQALIGKPYQPRWIMMHPLHLEKPTCTYISVNWEVDMHVCGFTKFESFNFNTFSICSPKVASLTHCNSLTHWLTDYKMFYFFTLKSNPRDLCPLRRLIRVMTKTKTKTFREYLQRPILETCDLWEIVTRRHNDKTKTKTKDKNKDHDKYMWNWNC